MLKKVLILFLLICVPLALFARGNSQPAAPTSGSLPYVEFDWYARITPQPDEAMVFEAANRYIQEKLNAKINFISMTNADWEQRMPVLVNSGGVNGVSYFGTQINYVSYANSGAFLALDDLLDRHAPATKAQFKTEVWDGMRVNGRIYGVPTLKDNAIIISGIYNATMAERLGINMTNVRYKSFVDLEPLLMEVLQKRNAQMPQYVNVPLIPLGYYNAIPYNFAAQGLVAAHLAYAVLNVPGLNEIAGYGADTVFNLFETPEYLRFAQTMARFSANGILPNANMDFSGDTSHPGLFLWPAWGDVIVAEHSRSNDFVTKLMPAARTFVDTSSYHSAGSAIGIRTRDPDRAMMAMNLMNTDSYLATLMRFGVEGQHYLRDSAGRMVLEGSPRNSDAAARGYLVWYGPYLGNLLVANAPESYGGPNNAFATALRDYNNNAALGYVGFVFDQSPVEQYIAACNAVTNEYRTVHFFGQLPESQVAAHIAEMNQKLRDNGVQRIIDEAQRQYNAWRARR